ncbi:MAG: hypothetical protein M0Z50_14170 [Planctomycetia bacterium]|nr:hypothetical protein [Planctomycetia bacterium]
MNTIKEMRMSVPGYAMPIYRFLTGKGELTISMGPEPCPACCTIWELILAYGRDDTRTFRMGEGAVFTMREIKESAKDILSCAQDDWEDYLFNVVIPCTIISDKVRFARLVEMMKEVHADPRHLARISETIGIMMIA